MAAAHRAEMFASAAGGAPPGPTMGGAGGDAAMAPMFAPADRMYAGPTVWSSEGDLAVAPESAPSAYGPHGHAVEHHGWSPYDFNGGTALGIAGDDFCVLACDTRLSTGYSILSRDVNRAAVLTDHCVVATGGCWTDVQTLHKVLKSRVDMYEHEHESAITCTAVAQMLGNTLYYRRFFPYYAFNVVGGIDAEGKGAVFTYDAVGSFERVKYAAQGAGQKLIIPLLDNLVGNKNRTDPARNLSIDETVEMMKDVFVTAGERDIYTGDNVDIYIMTADGMRKERFELKAD
uniref:Proteasome subunit beta n=1 Tax=Bicosoecida sp. CB-2014 TaxID=1486930 RepID=A0A7S1C425_9STRA|eukprot:CAMPEP_0203815898 /NCGR_PEP_ID=MMETSP0115-20131106/13120_1 /ASSEMBLY_ACC=CAM_ASM_000227 /TAXON_ID=33651 /ORGANISM="Bicosoecid sp, Strain ms1" /LENGTH=288 /DNA_ID=CAMNT_0050724797 /DNA_START=131 /DNA_END=997 /DNA_ORIENTATION=-